MDGFFDLFFWIVLGFIELVFLVILVALVTGRGGRPGRRAAASDHSGSDSSPWLGGSHDSSSPGCDSSGWSDGGGCSDGGGGGGD
jgi:hypothetical protein